MAARNLAAALTVMVCVGGGVAAAQTTTTAVSGDAVTLGVGAREGVRVGMTGRIAKQEMVGGQLQTFEIARFSVASVETSSCRVTLTEVGSGWAVEPGMDVVFDQRLVPPEPNPRPTPRPPAATPTPNLPSDPAELLRQGNAAWDRQEWATAVELYGALLRQVPGHPIAAERGDAAKAKVQTAQREAEAARRAAEAAQREAEERARRDRAEREALERERQNVPLYRETARTYLEQGQWDEAREWLSRIARVDPADSYLESVLGRELAVVEAEIAAGRLDGAQAGLTRLWGLLSEAQTVAVREQISAARDAAELAQVQAWVEEGDRLLSFGDRDGARRVWNQARGLSSGYPGLAERLEAVRLKVGDLWTDPVIEMRFRFVSPGTFTMGSSQSEAERATDERQHEVTLTRGFWLGETEVTQGQWWTVMGTNPSHFPECGVSCPVENVRWYDAVTFANALSRKAGFPECYLVAGGVVEFTGLACRGYRLPTEAEWEYAARAGTTTPFSTGTDLTTDEANFNGNYPYAGNSKGLYRQKTVPAQGFAPNPWGLHEVHGNVREWVWDRHGRYPPGTATDPTGSSTGAFRVSRGGSWDGSASSCRSADRGRIAPRGREGSQGLRLARTAE